MEKKMWARDVVARAFGWRDWQMVLEDSQRDGYTEAGGRGVMAAAIGKTARAAEDLMEYVERFGPEEDQVYEEPGLEARRWRTDEPR